MLVGLGLKNLLEGVFLGLVWGLFGPSVFLVCCLGLFWCLAGFSGLFWCCFTTE
jgi:hypothetical protein